MLDAASWSEPGYQSLPLYHLKALRIGLVELRGIHELDRQVAVVLVALHQAALHQSSNVSLFLPSTDFLALLVPRFCLYPPSYPVVLLLAFPLWIAKPRQAVY